MSSRISYLLNRYLSKTCTQEERQEFANIVLNMNNDEEMFSLLEDYWNQLEPAEKLDETRSDEIFKSILSVANVDTTDRKKNKSFKLINLFVGKKLAIAASVLFVISFVVYFLLNSKLISTQNNVSRARVGQDIKAPSMDKAVIVVSDGRTVALDSVQNGTLTMEGEVKVAKTADGAIVYKGSSTEVVFNTLMNPRGSKVVNITLQDGTKVWLNCESSLKYPNVFLGNERVVEIQGEAYLEVAKDPSKKFIVLAKGVRTEVLGTHFNVNAYNDLNKTSVTLLEGSIKVSNKNSSTMLTPGQQASLNEAGKIDIDKDAEIDEVIAWKNGQFNFNSLTIGDIMQQLQRWYDVDVEYDGMKSDKHFSGIFNRTENVSEVLRMMQLAGIKFKIEGKKIIVTE